MKNAHAMRGGRGGLVLVALALLTSCSSKSRTPITCGPPSDQLPDELACTGLYTNFESLTVAPTARPYAPAVSFWSDGYTKSRWIQLPDGQAIDATVMDQWKFPIGTKVWKEFSFNGRKIETRLLWKVSAEHWTFTSYVWAEDGSSAPRGEGKSFTIAGAAYHVPSVTECNDCHKGRADTLLGFEAISLAQPAATGMTLAVLAQENRITPPPAKTTIDLDPGIGVLHVNCGVSCHNETSAATRQSSPLRLKIGFDEATNKPMSTWELFTTTVNVPAALPTWNRGPLIAPGAPEKSIVIASMQSRDSGQMPPISRDVDFNGISAVQAFVKALPPP